jgi:hypothetical protein
VLLARYAAGQWQKRSAGKHCREPPAVEWRCNLTTELGHYIRRRRGVLHR